MLDVEAEVMEQAFETKLASFVRRRMMSFNDASHDYYHALRVRSMALEIASTIPEADVLLVSTAALAHDVADHKFDGADDAEEELRMIIGSRDPELQSLYADDVVRIVHGISWSKQKSISQSGGQPPTRSVEMDIVQDADRLDAMGAVGIARAFHFGGARNRDLADSLQHFHDKLLLLKDDMRTIRGRELAEARHVLMENFVKDFPQ